MSAHPDSKNFEAAAERDSDADRSKGGFKLTLIETANADPLLNGSDLQVLVAYCSLMSWPKREVWLSSTLARAKTGGLTDNTIAASRQKLQGIDRDADKQPGARGKPYRAYLSLVRHDGPKSIYRVDNPWLEEARDHVREATQLYRERQAERQAERRRVDRVTSKIEGTDMPLSPQELGGTSPQNLMAISPHHTPQDIAMKEGKPSKLGATPQTYGQEDDPHLPYPVPETAAELQVMLEELFAGCRLSATLMAGMRRMLLEGRLTPHMVEETRRFAS